MRVNARFGIFPGEHLERCPASAGFRVKECVTMKGRAFVLLLVVIYGSEFFAGFNENLMNMALVSIMGEFGVSSVTAQWLVTAYMIAATVMVTCTAFFFRRVKLRRLYCFCSVLTIAGSAMGLFAFNFPFLLAARLVQAIGSGMLIPMMISTILSVCPKNRLGVYMATGGCMITFGPAFAPVLCGSFVTLLGWRSIFLIPLIAMVILSVLAFFFLDNLETHEDHLDVPSVALSAVTLACLSCGLAQVSSNPLKGAGMIAVFLVAGAIFVRRQLRCKYPLIVLSPLKNADFWPGVILVFVAMMSTFSSTVLLPLYLEGAFGLTAFLAGVVMLVPVLMNAFTTLLSGRVLDSVGEWPLVPLGFVCIAVGFAILALTAPAMSIIAVLVGALFLFVGVGMGFTASQTVGLKMLPRSQNTYGVTIMSTSLQIAACVGPPMFIGLMSSVQAKAAAGGLSEALRTAQGFSCAAGVAAGFALFGALVACAFTFRGRLSKKLAAQPKLRFDFE